MGAKFRPDAKQQRGIEEMTLSGVRDEELEQSAKLPLGSNILVNRDFSFRPQNEPSIAIDPHNPRHLVVGYNDFRQDVPMGGGFSTSFNGGLTWHDGMIAFPLLFTDEGIVEPPYAISDPAIAFANDGTVYYSTVGFSQTFCENGIFVSRSDNGGISWWTPVIVPGRQGPRIQGVVVYHSSAFDCSIFHDKEYMAVDNSGGTHDGRVYVTWTRFYFGGPSGALYWESPIYLAYSDDRAVTWTVVGEINGVSDDLCEYQTETTLDGDGSACDENQYSYPVVGSDGTLYVHFLNAQNQSEWSEEEDFDDQILVVRINPDTFEVEGPFHVTMLDNGLTNYPLVAPDWPLQTICNGGWRLNAAGNIAIGPDDELYIVFADNRNGTLFPFPLFLSETIFNPGQTFLCPDDLFTDTDVFLLKSTDRGETWFNPATGVVGEPLEVTDDPPVRDQWFPWVTVSDNGRVYIVYHDRRQDPNNFLTHTFVATSRDGGASWRERRVSKVASDYHASYFGLGIFIGDYNNIAASGSKAYALWTDARTVFDADILMKVVRTGWHPW